MCHVDGIDGCIVRWTQRSVYAPCTYVSEPYRVLRVNSPWTFGQHSSVLFMIHRRGLGAIR